MKKNHPGSNWNSNTTTQPQQRLDKTIVKMALDFSKVYWNSNDFIWISYFSERKKLVNSSNFSKNQHFYELLFKSKLLKTSYNLFGLTLYKLIEQLKNGNRHHELQYPNKKPHQQCINHKCTQLRLLNTDALDVLFSYSVSAQVEERSRFRL